MISFINNGFHQIRSHQIIKPKNCTEITALMLNVLHITRQKQNWSRTPKMVYSDEFKLR